MEHFDVIVIGGGASGMMAAGRAAERGKRVMLIEKNRVLGKKLAITGGGRCNVTNAEYDTRTLLTHYKDAAKFLHSPFSQFGVKDTFVFFEALGLPLKIEAGKRAFPETERAEDVVAVMKRYLTRSHVTIKSNLRADGFVKKGARITGVVTKEGTYEADAFILATGGASHEETGASDEGIKWLAKLGHEVQDADPDIVPLRVKESWVTDLAGTSLTERKITFGEGKEKFTRTGRILFTHFGLSGPTILNNAHEVKGMLKKGDVKAYIDLFPHAEVGDMRATVLRVFEANKNKMLKNVMKDIAPSGMQAAVLSLIAPVLHDIKVHSISKEDRNSIADLMKAMPLTITGTMGYDYAVVSDGGISLTEVDTRTMASKKFPNLFVTGDVLHISRPSGGYSLQLCWTTGYVAGNSV